MRGNILISIIVGFAILIGGLVLVSSSYAHGLHFVLCHHTPGNEVTLTFHTIQGYVGHLGTPHSGSTYDTPGPCEEEEPSPTPSVSPSPTPSVSPSVEPSPEPSPDPSPSPSPSPVPCEQTEEGCEEPKDYCDTLEGVQAEDEDCPREEPEPTPVPLSEPGVGCTTDCHPSYSPPSCVGVYSDEPKWVHVDRVSPTEVRVEWATNHSTRNDLNYGYVGGNLEYGVWNLPGDAREFNIGNLEAGKSINVKVTTWRENCALSSQIIDP